MMPEDQKQAAVDAARHLLRNLTRCFGRSLRGHDLLTVQAFVNLRIALEAVDVTQSADEQDASP